MADENIPEVRYSELTALICWKCESSLVFDDQGTWYCENPECGYTEYNNITKCEGECNNLVLSSDFNFDKMEDRYCQIPHPETGATCLGYAINEQDHFEAEQQQLEVHIKFCTNPSCDCRNV